MHRALLLSDIHATDQRINAFEGDTFTSLEKKLGYIEEAILPTVDMVLAAGDIFNVPRPEYRVANCMLKFVKQCPNFWYIPGQHDMDSRVLSDNTVLSLLDGEQNVSRLSCAIPHRYIGDEFPVYVYGIKYSDNVEDMRTDVKELNKRIKTLKTTALGSPAKYIVLMHGPIFGNTLPHWAKKGWTHKMLAEELCEADLVHVGDVHEAFITYGKPIVVNTGPILRMSSRDTQIRPAPCIVDLSSMYVEFCPLPFRKEKVFSKPLTDSVSNKDQQILNALEDISKKISEGVTSWTDPELLELVGKSKLSADVKQVLTKMMQKVIEAKQK